MRLRLNLSDVDMQLKISNWVKCRSDEDWSDNWTNVELALNSNYINYTPHGELLLSVEVSELTHMMDDLLSGKLKEDIPLRFVEPDLSFRFRPA